MWKQLLTKALTFSGIWSKTLITYTFKVSCGLTAFFATYTGVRYTCERLVKHRQCCHQDLFVAISNNHVDCVVSILQQQIQPYQMWYEYFQQCYLHGKQWFKEQVLVQTASQIHNEKQLIQQKFDIFRQPPHNTHLDNLLQKRVLHTSYMKVGRWMPLLYGVFNSEIDLQLNLTPDNILLDQRFNAYTPKMIKLYLKYNNLLVYVMFFTLRIASDVVLEAVKCASAVTMIPNCLTYAKTTEMVDVILNQITIDPAWIKFAMEWHLLASASFVQSPSAASDDDCADASSSMNKNIYLHLKSLYPEVEPNLFKYFVKQPSHFVYRDVEPPTYKQKCFIRDWLESQPSKLTDLAYSYLPTDEERCKNTLNCAFQQTDSVLLEMCLKHFGNYPWLEDFEEHKQSFNLFSNAITKSNPLTPTEWVMKRLFLRSVTKKKRNEKDDDEDTDTQVNTFVCPFESDTEFQELQHQFLQTQEEHSLLYQTKTNLPKDVCRLIFQYC